MARLEYDRLNDKELAELLDRAELAVRLENDDNFKLFREAAKRISDKAIYALVNTPADDTVTIIQLQQVVKKYKFALFSELDVLKAEGEQAFEILKERGVKFDLT